MPWLQVVQLLGKLGGRNRRFLKKPTELDYKDNPEHGLRLILTFHPSTSFLVPLDRCIAMTRRAVAEGDRSESRPCTAQHLVPGFSFLFPGDVVAEVKTCQICILATSLHSLAGPVSTVMPGHGRQWQGRGQSCRRKGVPCSAPWNVLHSTS